MGPLQPNRVEPILDTYAWGRMIWLLDSRHTQNADMTLARMELDPQQTSEPHLHSNCSECVHLLEGEIQQHIGEDVYSLKPGQTVFIPADTPHHMHNSGDKPAVMMISYSESQRAYKKADLGLS